MSAGQDDWSRFRGLLSSADSRTFSLDNERALSTHQHFRALCPSLNSGKFLPGAMKLLFPHSHVVVCNRDKVMDWTHSAFVRSGRAHQIRWKSLTLEHFNSSEDCYSQKTLGKLCMQIGFTVSNIFPLFLLQFVLKPCIRPCLNGTIQEIINDQKRQTMKRGILWLTAHNIIGVNFSFPGTSLLSGLTPTLFPWYCR